MRYAILSDIHGNLEALEAVMDALSAESVEAYLSIGDVVGYGANPKECINILRSLEPEVLIAGNHEWGVLGLKGLEDFAETARGAISWTKKIMDKEDLEYLKSFSILYEDEKMTLVHGSLYMPEEFYYILNTDDAYIAIKEMKNFVCFVGHSHVGGIFAYNHKDVEVIEIDEVVRIDPDRRYIINSGSIGQPRNGDPRASYAVYDDEESTVEIKRVAYDIKKAQEKILKAELPPQLAYRLSEGR